MTLRRSASSLYSEHIFYRVDVVVYCEGKSGSRETHSNENARTLDVIYWSTVVEHLNLGLKFHFKSMGNKATLQSIARDVEKQRLSSITVCLDSDYERIMKKELRTARLAYTHGYSWENDVVTLPVLRKVLSGLIGPIPAPLGREFTKTIERFSRDLERWCEIDIALHARNKPCVLCREKPLSCIDLQSLPKLNTMRLRERLKEAGYKGYPRRSVKIAEGSACELSFGRLISKFVYHVIIFFAKKVMISTSLRYDTFMTIAVSNTFELIASGQLIQLGNHHQSQISAFALTASASTS